MCRCFEVNLFQHDERYIVWTQSVLLVFIELYHKFQWFFRIFPSQSVLENSSIWQYFEICRLKDSKLQKLTLSQALEVLFEWMPEFWWLSFIIWLSSGWRTLLVLTWFFMDAPHLISMNFCGCSCKKAGFGVSCEMNMRFVIVNFCTYFTICLRSTYFIRRIITTYGRVSWRHDERYQYVPLLAIFFWFSWSVLAIVYFWNVGFFHTRLVTTQTSPVSAGKL